MSNIDWSQKINIKYAEGAAEARAWQEEEMRLIAEQLPALEDGDPSALPGTEREWRDYRIKVRAWKEGAEGYPLKENYPQRPTGKA